MNYGIITPAHNEADFISDFMNSIVLQTRQPVQFIIVDDGSTDDTLVLASRFAEKHEWIKVVSHPCESGRAIGSKVVKAFLFGMGHAKHIHWDVIAKLDADQILPPDYFEQVLEVFQKNPKAGICGGVCAVPSSQSVLKSKIKEDPSLHSLFNRRDFPVKTEKQTDRFHVRGALKSYRADCYRDIGGLRPVYGWDTLDELLAEYHGWETLVLPELKVIHRRPTGAKSHSVKLHMDTGELFYRLGYGPMISFIASVKRYRMRPSGFSAIFSWMGYLRALVKRPAYYANPPERQFIRKLRFRRMRQKMLAFLKMKDKDDHTQECS